MDIFRYAITIAEEKSLLKAAQKLYITPSALSQAVARKEAELGTTLFVRSRNGWLPTAAGEVYLNMARRIDAIREKTYLDIRMLNTKDSPPVKIGMSAGHNADMFATILPQFMDRFPGSKIILEETPVLETIDRLRAGTIDVGFATSAFPIPNMALHRLATERFVLSVPKSDPLSGYSGNIKAGEQLPTVPLSLFRDHEFMCMQEGTTFRSAVDEMFKIAGFRPNMIFESSSMQTIRHLAMSGYAVTIMPAQYAETSGGSVYFYLDTPLLWNRYFAHIPQKTLSVQEAYLLTLSENYYRDRLTGQNFVFDR